MYTQFSCSDVGQRSILFVGFSIFISSLSFLFWHLEMKKKWKKCQTPRWNYGPLPSMCHSPDSISWNEKTMFCSKQTKSMSKVIFLTISRCYFHKLPLFLVRFGSVWFGCELYLWQMEHNIMKKTYITTTTTTTNKKINITNWICVPWSVLAWCFISLFMFFTIFCSNEFLEAIISTQLAFGSIAKCMPVKTMKIKLLKCAPAHSPSISTSFLAQNRDNKYDN